MDNDFTKIESIVINNIEVKYGDDCEIFAFNNDLDKDDSPKLQICCRSKLTLNKVISLKEKNVVKINNKIQDLELFFAGFNYFDNKLLFIYNFK